MIKRLLTRFSFILLASLLICSWSRVTFAAATCPSGMSDLDCASLYGPWTSWLPDDGSGSCGVSAGDISIAAGTDTAKWQTTLQPPYSLEDFMVEALNDLAGRLNVQTTDTVTQQHVLALVAMAWGEGGNLTNDDIYNPLNSGGDYPGIDLATAHSTSGVQSYATFNDGVDELARIMSGTGGAPTYQTRLGAILKDPSSTAQQFMKALTYYQNYKGNLEWAEASMPPNQDSYYQQRLGLISDTIANYKDRASTLIGPPGNTANQNLHSTHPLRYSFSSDTSSASGSAIASSSCGSGGVVAGDIVQTAVGLAWNDVTYPNHGDADTAACYSNGEAIGPEPSDCHHGFQESNDNPGSTNTDPTQYTTQSYQAAWAKYNKANSSQYTDCGVFVATVLHASGIATDYPTSSSGSQRQWAIDHPDKYMVKENPTVADLLPGDILVNSEHTFIYVGHVAGTQFTVAEASQYNHSPELDNVVSNEINGFTLVRVKS